jgi:hypothetical protein
MGRPGAADRPLRSSWAALLVLGACARLPEIDLGQCGNGVVEEETEDCDGFPAQVASAHPAQCRPPGIAGQCRLDCSRQNDGTVPDCPAGWGCDGTGLCRRPTNSFETEPEIEVGSATTLLSGDFDGDGRADVVSLEPSEGVGMTRMRVHYFDERAQLADTHTFPLLMIAPVAVDLSGDGRSDILFSDTRIALLRGRSDRTWVPDAFSSYRVFDSSLLTTTVYSGPIENTSSFVVFARLGEDQDGLYIVGGNANGVPHSIGSAPRVEDFVGEPVAGRFLEDAGHPCSQVLVAARGQTHFSMSDVCTTREGYVGPVWRTAAEQRDVPLDPPTPIDVAPIVGDLNGDGHLDALVGAGGISFVSYGDGQNLAPAVPFVISPANLPQPVTNQPMPLAVADVTGDGAPDFLADRTLAVSAPSSTGSGFDYGNYTLHPAGYWTTALSADLNGNSHPDFIAASRNHPGIDFFNGTGSITVTDFSILTNRPVQHLLAGDFDGDQISDVAFTEISSTSGLADSVFIAFGRPSGAPEPPQPVARVNNIQQLNSFRDAGRDHILVSSRENPGDRQRASLALLAGNGFGIPVASLDLTTFAADGSTNSSAPLRMAAGGFLGPGRGDVLALSYLRDAFELDLGPGMQAWLLPSLASDGTPALLHADFPPELSPISTGELTAPLSSSITNIDVDGDGRDEVVMAMPRNDGARCSVLLYGVEPDQLVPRGDWIVEEPCQRVEVRALDADSDGVPDLLLLTGASDASTGTLSVFWNEGGHFAVERRTLLTNDAPQAFAVLKATTARHLSFAYVNPSGLSLVTASEQAHEFDPPELQVARPGCTGIVAADVNGDGAADLVYAADGNLEVRKAILESR